VPHPTNESDASTLPDPELNPLLNPLLAAHMGRWAEVYFTNPPEKRGQAVAALIRELENISSPEPAFVQVMNDQRMRDEREKDEAGTGKGLDLSRAAVETVRACSACAHNNSSGQEFCGRCGSPLQIAPEERLPQVAEAPISEASWSKPERSLGGNSVEYAIERAGRSPAADRSHDAPDSIWAPPEKEFPHFAVAPELAPFRYRLYVSVAAAILLLVLGYMGWRGRKAVSGVAGPQSAPSSVIPPAKPAPEASAPRPGATRSTLPEGNFSSPVQRENQPGARSRKNQTADAQPASRVLTVAASSSTLVAEQSGAEELATAEKYLNGAQGMPRDSREAAQWLWKAVGKGNTAATMALSDLYLRGDGVSKSCDQAHLLLDAAARKGLRAAADRLRNLQAFGCE
jgi:hypothetical protein